MPDTLHGELDPPRGPQRIGNMDKDTFSTNERRLLPLCWGRNKAPGLWLGQIYDQYEVPAPNERPGGKK